MRGPDVRYNCNECVDLASLSEREFEASRAAAGVGREAMTMCVQGWGDITVEPVNEPHPAGSSTYTYIRVRSAIDRRSFNWGSQES